MTGVGGGSSLVKQIVMAIVADPGDAKAALDDLSAQADQLAHPRTLNIVADTGEARAETDAVTEALSKYIDASLKAGEASARLGEIDREAAGGEQEYSAALDAAAEASLRATDAALRLSAAEEGVTAKTDAAAASQEEAAGKTDTAAAGAAGWGEKLKLAALGAVAAGAIGVKMAANMDQATTRLVTSAGESEKNIGLVRSGLLSLSSQTATSMGQLEQGMYLVESAGYHGAQGLNVLKAAAQGAYEEGAQVGTMANAVTSALNAYHLPASAAVTVTNQMLAAVGQGKMTLQDFAGSLAAVLPVAAAAHLSFAQVGGGIATMTAQGTSAQEAAQLLRHTIVALQAPNNVQIAEMQQLGVNSNALAKNIGKTGLTGTIQELETAILHQMGPAGMVLLKSLNQSKLAAQSAQEEIKAMPPSIRGLAEAYAQGKISVQDWQQALFKGTFSANQKMLLEQFATTEKAAHGFNNQLAAGGSDAQTFTSALSKVMGGAEGLQVALQVGGAHATTFAHNVAVVGKAATETGSNIHDWGITQNQVNFQLSSAKYAAEAAATSFGQALMPAVIGVLHPVVDVAQWFAKTSGAGTALAAVVGGVLTVVLATKLASGLKTATGAVEGLWQGFTKLAQILPGVGGGEAAAAGETEALAAAQEGQAASAEGATAAQEGLNVAMDANPIGAIILALVVLGVGIYEVVRHWKDFKQWGLDALHWVEHAAEDTWHWIEGHWPLLLAVLTGPIGLATLYIVDHWHQIVDGADQAIHDVGNFFLSLPGRILSWVASFGHLLWNAGADLLRGLLGGIESAVGAVVGAAEHVGSDVLHGIEWALGIGSPSRITFYHGQMLAAGLIGGMDSMHGSVLAAADRLAGAALPARYPGTARGGDGFGAAQAMEILLRVQPSASGSGLDHLFMTWLMEATRKMGGDPAMYQRKVAFR